MARIGKYELVRKLAKGGMAEVFLARSEWARGLEKTVVVKRILPEWAEDPHFVEMFFSEAQLASQLSHPNIAQIIDFGEADGVHFLAMEYVDGPSLRALSKSIRECRERMPFSLCARIVASACEALAYAHDLTDSKTGQPLQLVHRDVSPDNILISKAGAVKLVDFGIAKAVTQDHHTKTGTVKGKVSYMSPEQLQAEPLDRRADVYSLGVVLYELIAGTKPYDIRNEAQLINAILHKDRVPLLTRRPDTPPQLDTIVHRALERDQEIRYPDCRVMHADLEQFLISLHQPAGAFQIAELVRQYEVPTTSAPELPPTREAPVEPPEREVSETRPIRAPGPVPPEPRPSRPSHAAPQTPVSVERTGNDGDQTVPEREVFQGPEVTKEQPAAEPMPSEERPRPSVAKADSNEHQRAIDPQPQVPPSSSVAKVDSNERQRAIG